MNLAETWEKSKRAIILLKKLNFQELEKDNEVKVVIDWLKFHDWASLWNNDRHEYSPMITRDFYTNLWIELNENIFSSFTHL